MICFCVFIINRRRVSNMEINKWNSFTSTLTSWISIFNTNLQWNPINNFVCPSVTLWDKFDFSTAFKSRLIFFVKMSFLQPASFIQLNWSVSLSVMLNNYLLICICEGRSRSYLLWPLTSTLYPCPLFGDIFVYRYVLMLSSLFYVF